MPQQTRVINAPRLHTLALPDLTETDADYVYRAELIDCISVTGGSMAGRDLDELVLVDSELTEVDLSETNLTKSRLSDSRFQTLSATALRAPKAELRHCEFTGCRLGFFDLAGAELRGIRFQGCKLGYVNLRGATVLDVTFEDCRIEELDLADATVERVAFPDSQADAVNVSFASARDVDLRTARIDTLKDIRTLRGLVIDDPQLIQFSPLFARQLGVRVA